MLLKDVFKEIFVGYNVTNSTGKSNYAKVFKHILVGL